MEADDAGVALGAPLIAWVLSHGGAVNGLRVASFGDGTGRGVAATRALSPGDELVVIPDGLTLTALAGVAGRAAAEGLLPPAPPVGSPGAAASAAAAKSQALVVALMAELHAGDASEWAPYLRFLAPLADGLLNSSAGGSPLGWPAGAPAALLAGTEAGRRLLAPAAAVWCRGGVALGRLGRPRGGQGPRPAARRRRPGPAPTRHRACVHAARAESDR